MRWIRFEYRKFKDRFRFRLIIFDRPVFGFNSHELPKAKRRGDFRKIKHIHRKTAVLLLALKGEVSAPQHLNV